VSITSQTVESSGSDVLIRVGGGEGEEEDTGVDDVRKTGDSCRTDYKSDRRGVNKVCFFVEQRTR
jgi:hypothetical protein